MFICDRHAKNAAAEIVPALYLIQHPSGLGLSQAACPMHLHVELQALTSSESGVEVTVTVLPERRPQETPKEPNLGYHSQS